MKTHVLILLLAVVVLAACRRAEITGVERNPEGGLDVSANLSEADINAAIADALAIQNPLLRDPQVDLQNRQIVVTGSHQLPNGGETVSGSLTFTLSVNNGALLAQITDADIQGVDLSDERISNFNQRISERMTNRANRENRAVTVQSVNVTDSAVEITFNIQRQ
jgi:uncharacterized protein YjbI with pentapeptide repeats